VSPAKPLAATAAALALLVCTAVRDARAQQVFSGDPVDPSTSAPYPLMPGVGLVLPGPDDDFGTGDDIVNGGITGDIDLVVRVGTIAAGVIPPPAGAAGGPALTTTIGGGGTTGQGAETPFSVHVSTGSGSAYGSTITNADLNGRPVTVYGFADLDGDGVVGPTNADGTSDNALERQEAYAYAGRQVGQISTGRALGSIGVHLAAPASIGGLRVSLSAGAFTGTDANALYSDGTAIYTLWPFFPPLDPKRVLEGTNSPSPDPTLPSELKFDIERNYLPAPGHPLLGTPFAVPVDGSEGSTDQFVSVSGSARATRFFVEADASTFRPTSRTRLRPAPAVGGGGRALVLPLSDVELPADAAATTSTVRLLPIDLLGNVADTPPGGIPIVLTVTGAVRIVAPDSDVDDTRETLTLGSAAGIVVTLDDAGEPGVARIDVTSGARILDSLSVHVLGSAGDQDGDGVIDDGNASGVAGDTPCNENDFGELFCDDNCALTANAHQSDSNLDGLGDCCDGECVANPDRPHCGECVFVGTPATPGSQALSKARWRFRAGNGGKPDNLRLRAKLSPTSPSAIAPDSEVFTVSLVHDGGVLFGAAFDSAFSLLSSKPKYAYADPTGAVSGVTKVTLSGSGSGLYSLVLRASAVGLLAPDSGPWQIAVRSGDDSFVGTTICATKASGLSCAQ
jgi:hypothetical protein